MGNAWKHFKTITHHRILVAKGCFKVGLYRQGLLHDMSKYSPSEFMVGVKYYQGNRSPNNAEREDIGYSSAWLHHKGRNKHHYEYWVDYSRDIPGGMVAVPMPDKYIAEMVMDRIAASKVYKGAEYKDSNPLEYYLQGKETNLINPDTSRKLHYILKLLAEKGEDEMYKFIRNDFLKGKYEDKIKQEDI